MNKRAVMWGITLMVFFAFFFPFVVAEETTTDNFTIITYSTNEDFSVTSSPKIFSACSCTTLKDLVVLTNTGNVKSTYTISYTGSAATWAVPAQPSIALAPGEQTTVITYITVPCKVSGTFSLDTLVQTTTEKQKILSQTIVVQNCLNLQLTSPAFSSANCPCQPTRYNLTITNTGSFREYYSFSVDQYAAFTTLSHSAFWLDPGASKDMYVYLTFPCESFGITNVSFITQTKKSGLEVRTPLSLAVLPCYNYSAWAPLNSTLCELTNELMPIRFFNDASFTNTYELTLDGPDWVTLSNASLSVQGNRSENTTLMLAPPLGSHGNYTAMLTSLSTLGAWKLEKEIPLTVASCYLPALDVSKDVDKRCCGSATYDVLVSNEGSLPATINLTVVGQPEWAILSSDVVDLEPGSEQLVTLSVNPPCTETQTLTLTILATIVGHEELSALEELSLEILSDNDCYRLNLTKTSPIAIPYEPSEHILTVYHTGGHGAVYQLSLEPEWMTLEPTAITLNPGEAADVLVSFYPNENASSEDYEATLLATTTVEDEELYYSFTLPVVLEKSSSLADFFVNYWFILLLLFILLLFIIALIFLFSKRRKKTDEEVTAVQKQKGKQNPWRIPRIVALGLLILVFLFIVLMSMGSYYIMDHEYIMNQSQSAFALQSWPVNTVRVIALHEHFDDPDNDPLTYTSTTPVYVTVSIDNRLGLATLTPPLNWSGTDQVMFIAHDQQNATESPLISLEVYPTNQTTSTFNVVMSKVNQRFGTHVLGLLLFLFFLVLAFRCLEIAWQEKQDNTKLIVKKPLKKRSKR
ncbi:hypothetical protein HYW21_05030 [Candidatus Woesearchaeota archaeon]|nr:hypothetical protein [Candidatus Woesearchaeota archaeon]